MPTVPNFNDDNEKIDWLREWFPSRGAYNAQVAAWDVSAQRNDSAVTYAGYVAATIVTIMSGIQSVLTSDSKGNATAISILSYAQTAIGFSILAIGTICKILKETHATPRDRARQQFPAAFWAAHADNTIWPDPNVPTILKSQCVRSCWL